MSVSTRLHVAQGQTRLRESSLASRLLTAAVLTALGADANAQQFDQLDPTLNAVRTDTTAIKLADVDGDGDLDLLTGNGGGFHLFVNAGQAQNRLYRNDGRGEFSEAVGALPVDLDPTTSLAVGDVDGDGDIDLVVGNGDDYYAYGRQNRLYLNDGNGVFSDVTSSRLPAVQDLTHDLALGDVDGDGDLDLVVANSYSPNRLYLNDGAGVFTDVTAAQMPPTFHARSIRFGDVDADGDLDLVVGNWGQNQLLRNGGSGIFQDVTASCLPTDSDFTQAIDLGDVDADGDLDLVIGNGHYWDAQNRLYRNDGGGTFVDVTASHLPATPDKTAGVHFADLDLDGDLDLLSVQQGAIRLYANDSAGSFSDVTNSRIAPPTQNRVEREAALGDIDGDGDLDVVLGCSFYQTTWSFPGGFEYLLRNLQRQLHEPSAPTTGQTYTLDVYARDPQPSLFDVALPYLSTASANATPSPFGMIGIDISQAVGLPPTLVPQAAGVASVQVLIPNNPALVGLDLHAQALLVPYPLPPRLTNVTLGTVQ